MAATKKIDKERISEFHGLITDADLTNIPKTMSPDCRNVRPMLGGLKSRAGHDKVNITSYNEPIRELFVIPLTSGFLGNQAGGGIGSGAGGGGTGAGAGGGGTGIDDGLGNDGGGGTIIVVDEDGDVNEAPLDFALWCKIPWDQQDQPLFPHIQLDDTSDMSSPWLDNESKTSQANWQIRNVTDDGEWQALQPLHTTGNISSVGTTNKIISGSISAAFTADMVNQYFTLNNQDTYVINRYDSANAIWLTNFTPPVAGLTNYPYYISRINYRSIMRSIRVDAKVYYVRYNVAGDTAGIVRGTNYLRFRFWDGFENSSWSAIKQVII